MNRLKSKMRLITGPHFSFRQYLFIDKIIYLTNKVYCCTISVLQLLSCIINVQHYKFLLVIQFKSQTNNPSGLHIFALCSIWILTRKSSGYHLSSHQLHPSEITMSKVFCVLLLVLIASVSADYSMSAVRAYAGRCIACCKGKTQATQVRC